MCHYIEQPCTPSFCIGLVKLVKIKSDFIVRSVEVGLGRLTVVVAVISVDAYPFMAFSYLACHLEDTWIGVYCLIVRRPNLEVATKRLLHQQVKIPAGPNLNTLCIWHSDASLLSKSHEKFVWPEKLQKHIWTEVPRWAFALPNLPNGRFYAN